MSRVAELIAMARDLGAEFELIGDRIKVIAPMPLPDDLMRDLRHRRDEVAGALSDRLVCLNPLTPHASHEFYWECDPDQCYCYRQFGRPMLCQGIPCRWIWPDGTAAN